MGGGVKGNTALHVSAARGSTRALLFLLEYAAIADVQNDVGDTPLHLAVWFGNHECVQHLLDYSASLDMLNSYGLDPYNNVFSRYVIFCTVVIFFSDTILPFMPLWSTDVTDLTLTGLHLRARKKCRRIFAVLYLCSWKQCHRLPKGTLRAG